MTRRFKGSRQSSANPAALPQKGLTLREGGRRGGCSHLLSLGHQPWLVDPGRGHVLELGHPVTDVVAVEIVVFGLLGDVELVQPPSCGTSVDRGRRRLSKSHLRREATQKWQKASSSSPSLSHPFQRFRPTRRRRWLLTGEACRCHPVTPVGRNVVVDEKAFEVVCSLAPVNAEVQNQVAGNVLAPTV